MRARALAAALLAASGAGQPVPPAPGPEAPPANPGTPPPAGPAPQFPTAAPSDLPAQPTAAPHSSAPPTSSAGTPAPAGCSGAPQECAAQQQYCLSGSSCTAAPPAAAVNGQALTWGLSVSVAADALPGVAVSGLHGNVTGIYAAPTSDCSASAGSVWPPAAAAGLPLITCAPCSLHLCFTVLARWNITSGVTLLVTGPVGGCAAPGAQCGTATEWCLDAGDSCGAAPPVAAAAGRAPGETLVVAAGIEAVLPLDGLAPQVVGLYAAESCAAPLACGWLEGGALRLQCAAGRQLLTVCAAVQGGWAVSTGIAVLAPQFSLFGSPLPAAGVIAASVGGRAADRELLLRVGANAAHAARFPSNDSALLLPPVGSGCSQAAQHADTITLQLWNDAAAAAASGDLAALSAALPAAASAAGRRICLSLAVSVATGLTVADYSVDSVNCVQPAAPSGQNTTFDVRPGAAADSAPGALPEAWPVEVTRTPASAAGAAEVWLKLCDGGDWTGPSRLAEGGAREVVLTAAAVRACDGASGSAPVRVAVRSLAEPLALMPWAYAWGIHIRVTGARMLACPGGATCAPSCGDAGGCLAPGSTLGIANAASPVAAQSAVRIGVDTPAVAALRWALVEEQPKALPPRSCGGGTPFADCSAEKVLSSGQEAVGAGSGGLSEASLALSTATLPAGLHALCTALCPSAADCSAQSLTYSGYSVVVAQAIRAIAGAADGPVFAVSGARTRVSVEAASAWSQGLQLWLAGAAGGSVQQQQEQEALRVVFPANSSTGWAEIDATARPTEQGLSLYSAAVPTAEALTGDRPEAVRYHTALPWELVITSIDIDGQHAASYSGSPVDVVRWQGDPGPDFELGDLLLVRTLGTAGTAERYSAARIGTAPACGGALQYFNLGAFGCDVGTQRCSALVGVSADAVDAAHAPWPICISFAAEAATELNARFVVVSIASVGGEEPGGHIALFSGTTNEVALAGPSLGSAVGRLSFGLARGGASCAAPGSSCEAVLTGWAAAEVTDSAHQVVVKLGEVPAPGDYCTCSGLGFGSWQHTGVGALVLDLQSISSAPAGATLAAVHGANPPSPLIAGGAADAGSGLWLSVRQVNLSACASCSGAAADATPPCQLPPAAPPSPLQQLSPADAAPAPSGFPTATAAWGAGGGNASATRVAATATLTQAASIGWRVPEALQPTPRCCDPYPLCVGQSSTGPWAALPHRLLVANVTFGVTAARSGGAAVSLRLRGNASVAVTGSGLSRAAVYFSVQGCTSGVCCGELGVDPGFPACGWGCNCAALNGTGPCDGLTTGGISSEAHRVTAASDAAGAWAVRGDAAAQVATSLLGAQFALCVAAAPLYGTCGTTADVPPRIAFTSTGVAYEVAPSAQLGLVRQPSPLVDWRTGTLAILPQVAVVSEGGAVLSAGALQSSFIQAFWRPAVPPGVAWQHPAGCSGGMSVGCEGMPYKEEMLADVHTFDHTPLLGRHGVEYTFQVQGSGVLDGRSDPVAMGPCGNDTRGTQQYALLFVPYSAGCRDCPAGLRCDGTAVVRPAEGWWIPDNHSVQPYDCRLPYGADACGFDGLCTEGYRPADVPHRLNPRCTICAEGYGKAIQNQCLACRARWADSLLVAVGTLVFLLIVAVLVLATLPAKHDAFGVLVKILLNHLTVSARVGDFSSSMQELLQPLYQAQNSIAEVPTEFAAADCALQLTFFQKFLLVQLSPFILVLLLFCFFALWRCLRRLRVSERPALRRATAIRKPVGRNSPPQQLGGGSSEQQTIADRVVPLATPGEQCSPLPTEAPLMARGEAASFGGDGATAVAATYAEHSMPMPEAATPKQRQHTDPGSPLGPGSSRSPECPSWQAARDGAEGELQGSADPAQGPSLDPCGITWSRIGGSALISESGDFEQSGLAVSGKEDAATVGTCPAPQQAQKQPSAVSVASAADEGYDGDALVPRLFGVDTSKLWRLFAQTVVVGLFLLYPTLLTTCARMLKCETVRYYHAPDSEEFAAYVNAVDEGTASESMRFRETSFLMADYRVLCEGAQYERYWKWAVALFLAYGVGIPIGIMIFVKMLTRKLGKKQTYQMFSFFISGYRTGNRHGTIASRWWWEVVPMFRKMSMVCITVFLGQSDQQGQLLGTYVALCTMLAFLAAQVLGAPFHTPQLNSLEAFSEATIVFTLALSLLYVYVPPSDSSGLGLLDPDAAEQWRRTAFVVATVVLAVLNAGVTLTLLYCIAYEGRAKLREMLRDKADLISANLHRAPRCLQRCVLCCIRKRCSGAYLEQTPGCCAALVLSADGAVFPEVVPVCIHSGDWTAPSGTQEWHFVRSAPHTGFTRWELREFQDGSYSIYGHDEKGAEDTVPEGVAAVWWARRAEVGADGAVVVWARRGASGKLWVGAGGPPEDSQWEPVTAFYPLSDAERDQAAEEGRWRIAVVQDNLGAAPGAAPGDHEHGQGEAEWSDEDDPDAPAANGTAPLGAGA
eukprot:TRINITY_DN4020_c2_g1_i2.p1 TRINITY_DN4020_c2_g1~~TRINITY_DN4020_c2_g1_i2.p1  ORF type:complete len:2467 (+),score=600.67 TRINITY_DN4020_c2_g1_i2:67-7467(+)